MPRMHVRLGFTALLTTALAACAASPNDLAESAPDVAAAPPGEEGASGAASGESGDDGNVVAGEPKIVAELTLGEEHTLTFAAIEAGDGAADILVAESQRPESPSALTSILDVDGESMTAHDVFFALSEPGAEIPESILAIERGLVDRAQGWALDKLRDLEDRGAMQTRAAGTKACENSSFTSGTYGGILPNNASWLDRNPSTAYSQYLYTYYGPNGLTEVSSPRVSFTLARHGISQYRGKVCVQTVEAAGLPLHGYYHKGQNQWVDLPPQASFQYRRPGKTNWSHAASIEIPVGKTRSMQWAFFGHAGEKWDWRMTLVRAQPQDFVDYMRSYLD